MVKIMVSIIFLAFDACNMENTLKLNNKIMNLKIYIIDKVLKSIQIII